MTDAQIKPLNWTPEADIGYTVARRPDGGMHFTFSDATHATLAHWRNFSMQHLLDSDRLVCNLYDLRQLTELPEEAVQFSLELLSDPSTRNIRLAVVVSSESVDQAVSRIADLTTPSGADMAVFHSMEEAEAWLGRPLTLLV